MAIGVSTEIKGQMYGELFRALVLKCDSFSKIRLVPGQKGFVYVADISALQGYDNTGCGESITSSPVIGDVPVELEYFYKQTSTCNMDFWDTAFAQMLGPGADGNMGSVLPMVSEPWMEYFRAELEKLAWYMATVPQAASTAGANAAEDAILAAINATSGFNDLKTSRTQSGLLTQLIVNLDGTVAPTQRVPGAVAITYLNVVDKLSEIIAYASGITPALFVNGMGRGVFFVSANIMGLIGIANISQAFRDVFKPSGSGFTFNGYEIVPIPGVITGSAGKDVIVFGNPMDFVIPLDSKSDDTSMTLKEDVKSPHYFLRAAYRMGSVVMNRAEKFLYVA